MAFPVYTFETNPEGNLGFAFHQNVGEGQELYFLSKFDPGTEDAVNIAEHIFSVIVENLEKAKKKDIYDNFESAIKEANLVARKYQSQCPQCPVAVVALFDFHHLYLTQSGTSEAYLLRDGNVSQISENQKEEEDLFMNILSGQVNIEDIVILSSNRVLRTVTSKELGEIFNHPDFQKSNENFRETLSQKSNEDLLVSVIGIGKKETSLSSGFLSKVLTAKTPFKKKLAQADSLEELDETDTLDTPNEKKHSLFASNQMTEKLKSWLPKKNIFILIFSVLVIFSTIVGINYISSESETEIKLREELNIAREAIQQADVFLIQGERESAKEFLDKAHKSVQTIFTSNAKLYRSDAQFLLADIQAKQLQVENARQVTPQLVADLSLKNENSDAWGLLPLKGALFTYDRKNITKTIRNIIETPTPILDEKNTILAAASRPDQSTLLFLTDAPRIIEYREGLITPMQTQDENWKSGIDIKTYGRYTYVLDPRENQIWKYERKRSNYSNSVPYNQGANLAEAVSFTIDGSIYVISASGNIQKIFRGLSQNYDFKGMPSTPISGPNVKIHTNVDLDYLYILDPDNQRILIFVKGDRYATYRRQILYNADNDTHLSDVRDFILDESGQRVNLMTKSRIYELNL